MVGGIEIDAVGRGRAERSHLIASVGSKAAIGDEEVVVLTDMLDVGTFAARPVAAGDALAEVGVREGTPAVVVLDGIGDGVVTQAGLFIELDDEDAAEPGAIDHPQLPVFIEEYAGVNVVGPILRPVVASVVAVRQLALCADSHLEVGSLPVEFGSRGIAEAGVVDRALINVGTHDVVGREQHDDRVPVVTIDALVHTPFLHRGVIDEVRCPHIPRQIPVCLVSVSPFRSVEIAERHLRHHVVDQRAHGLRLVRGESFCEVAFHHCTLFIDLAEDGIAVEAAPVLHVVGTAGESAHGAHEVVVVARRVNDAGVMDADAAAVDSRIEGVDFRECHRR